jgi:hypothetical protein
METEQQVKVATVTDVVALSDETDKQKLAGELIRAKVYAVRALVTICRGESIIPETRLAAAQALLEYRSQTVMRQL